MTVTFFSGRRWAALIGPLSGLWFAGALAFFAARVPGYAHAMHPPALLGASGMPDAFAWNLFGFVVPGTLAAVALHGVYAALRAGGAGGLARVGATLLLLSALAFGAQGLVPLRLGQALDAGLARIHIVLWMLWWLAASAGFVASALGRLRRPTFAIAALLTATIMLLALHATVLPIPGGVRERIALAAWFVWIAVASWRARRQP
jgi:hypothetical protein